MRLTGGDVTWGSMVRRAVGTWVVVAVVLGLTSGSARATAPGVNGPIAFSSYGKIFTIQPDGSALQAVVLPDEEHKYNYSPSWSPDGLFMVTSGEMLGSDDYYHQGLEVFFSGGTGFEHLPIPPFVSSPAWSPNGAHILFTSEGELLSTTDGGASPTRIERNALSPAWSPDGEQIAFVRSSSGPYEDAGIYTMDPDGGDVQMILGLPGDVGSPSWSPDGSEIAFTYWAREVRVDPGPGESPYAYSGPNIYVVSAAGGQPVQLTDSGTDRAPDWSPDGSMIAFQSERLSVLPQEWANLYLMNADGSDQHPLTTAINCLQCDPDWASLPPHSRPPATSAQTVAVAPTQGAEPPPRIQDFSNAAMTRPRFAWPSRVWVRFQAAVAEKVHFTIRRAIPPGNVSTCAREPSACVYVGRNERQAREGFNRISLGGLLGGAPVPGQYWLQLASSSSDARADLAFRVMPPRHKQLGSHRP
jgi:Tol biopolymer transport system component